MPTTKKKAPKPPKLAKNPLTEADLLKLRKAYGTGAELKKLLRTFLPDIYSPSKDYNDAINRRFYSHLLPDDISSAPRAVLSFQDVERCIIALLASRGEQGPLAIHIYIALMEKISAEEIANIILLAGIYSGVGNLTQGLFTVRKTLELLSQRANPNLKLEPPPQKPADPLGPKPTVLGLMHGFGLL